jgi:DMSO/TMAO reductase YedYZ molybdopterin-dependent catalytic subunit
VVIGIAASLIFTNLGSSNLLPSGEPPQAQIMVTGDVAAQKTLTVGDVSRMPLCNVTATIDGERAIYVGVTLLELCTRVGANWDAGSITVSGISNYQTLNIYQAYNSTQHPGSEIILAIAKNGKWLPDTEGPFKLVTPNFTSEFNVKGVVEINIKPWTINVSGTSQPLTLTGENITGYEVKTVTGPFAPGGGPQRMSDWTGVSVWSVLQAAGVPAGVDTVTVTSIDGYRKDFTVSQAQNLMFFGFEENAKYLTPADGGPFRLFLPTEDMKWGQYWVRYVAEVKVS